MEHNTDPSRQLVRVEQAGDILAIGRSTIYELIAQGKIETVHIGRCCRIPVAALDEYVRRLREAEPTSPEA